MSLAPTLPVPTTDLPTEHPTVAGLHLERIWTVSCGEARGYGYGSHISAECQPGGSGQCDGFCATHQHEECICSCHTSWDLPDTVVEVLAWHDDMNGIVRRGDEVYQWRA